jgi:hypothetical protein
MNMSLTDNKAHPFFASLPPELQHYFARYLSVRDVGVIKRTCRANNTSFRHDLSRPGCWWLYLKYIIRNKDIHEDYFGENLVRYRKCIFIEDVYNLSIRFDNPTVVLFCMKQGWVSWFTFHRLVEKSLKTGSKNMSRALIQKCETSEDRLLTLESAVFACDFESIVSLVLSGTCARDLPWLILAKILVTITHALVAVGGFCPRRHL